MDEKPITAKLFRRLNLEAEEGYFPLQETNLNLFVLYLNLYYIFCKKTHKHCT